VGDPIVAVVAANRYAAEDAAAAVAVADEVLEAVRGAEAAIAEDAALLHEHLGDNIAADFTVQAGDVDAALRSTEVVTRGRYYVHRHTGMQLETRGAIRYRCASRSPSP
jgi:carbon-monoxide dehydrogenase large subunit